MPAITVIVTTHNLERYIGDCLSDLFGQTFQDFELLAVDDASTDGTRAILGEWKSRYPRQMRLLWSDHPLGMPARTRNFALERGNIQGNYFLFQDGDDRVEPQFLERLYTIARESESDVSICGYDRVERDTGRVLCREMTGFPAVLELPPKGDELAFINTAVWNKLWSRRLLDSLRYTELRVGEETIPHLTAFSQCSRLAFTGEILLHYQVHGDSVISNTQEEDIRALVEEMVVGRARFEGCWRDTLDLMALMHLGVSMAIRGADNPEIHTAKQLRMLRSCLGEQFGWLRGNPLVKLRSLKRREVKGVLLWICLWSYQLGLFGAILRAYRWLVRIFHVDLKF